MSFLLGGLRSFAARPRAPSGNAARRPETNTMEARP